MGLPRRALLVIGLAATSGTASAAAAIRFAGHEGFGRPLTVGVLCALAAASMVWPLLIFRGDQSEAVHLDEGFFILMALLLPPLGTMAAFGLAVVIAQVARRRPFVKAIFNFGQILTAVGAALVVVQLIAPPQPRLTLASLGAAVVGAAVFFVVNTCFLGAVLTATGAGSFRRVVADGIEIRVVLDAACLGLGAITALAVSGYDWAVVFAGVPFLILRQVLAGHFRARHDRERMQGLFEATLEANRSMGADDVEVAIAGWAQRLLRSAKAELVTERPRTTGTVEPVLAAGVDSRWLVVSGRSKNEPFDSADQSLLEALTAVGAGALANARLYSEMERQQDRLATIAATLGEGVCAVDLAGRVTFVNPAAQEMLGLTDDEMVGIASGASLLRLPFLEAPAMHAMGTSSTVRDDDTIFQDRGGAALPVAFTCSPIIEDGEPTGAVIAFRDIAERKAFEQRLAHHAFHDALTGLPNRRVFLDRLDQALGRSKRSAQIHAVLFADVDRFKVINDGIGHLGGDHLLAAIADRLSSVLRPGDTLARFGGDEYTMLLEDIGGPAEAEAATARILSTLNTPIVLPSGHEVVATLSIGIALAGAGATADDVLHNADVAMYQAKAQGPGRFEMFDPRAMGARSVERVEMETALRRAIEFNEIEVHYQPVFTSDNLSIVGAEALVRWRHPTRGLLPPADFITLAEETGLILNLGTRVLETACRDAKSWFEEFGLPLTVAVNLSFRQFAQADLARQVATVLDKTGLDPSRLCLEITESVAVHDFDRTIAMLHELKDLGIHLAIDDFGTGYSSLNYLKQFPVDIVKLDRGFIAGLETSTVDSAIVAAVVALSDAIGMSIVAEGVENTAQLERLRSLGCPLVQGYLFAKPMPNAEIAGLLKLRHASDARLIDATEPRPATVDASAVLIAGL